MGHINYAGVLKGGIAAGVIMNISEFVLNIVNALGQMDKAQPAASLPRPVGGQFVVLVGMTVVLGIMTVWLYAAIRPRLGAGPGTAICAGLVVWTLSYLYMTITVGVLGISSMGIVLMTVVWTAAEMILASAVGGFLYTEGA
jgi:hypothetical protein